MEDIFFDGFKINTNFTRKSTHRAVPNIRTLFYSVIETVLINHYTSKVNLCLTRVLFQFTILKDPLHNY
jgi:hypothetical protein